MTRLTILAKFEAHDILPTPQRLEVANILLRKPQHLSADQIIDRLRDNGSTVSKATVYNTLKLFEKNGLIKERNVDPERRFYDSATHPHHHFYHVGSGKLTDIAADEIAITNLPDLPAGTKCDGVEILIRIRSKQR
jgi:Fur family iron response transcriptional regulator